MSDVTMLERRNRKLKLALVVVSVIVVAAIFAVFQIMRGGGDKEKAPAYSTPEAAVAAFRSHVQANEFNMIPPQFSKNYFIENKSTEEMLYKQLRQSFEPLDGEFGLETMKEMDSTHRTALLVYQDTVAMDGKQFNPTLTLELLYEKYSWKIDQYTVGSRENIEKSRLTTIEQSVDHLIDSVNSGQYYDAVLALADPANRESVTQYMERNAPFQWDDRTISNNRELYTIEVTDGSQRKHQWSFRADGLSDRGPLLVSWSSDGVDVTGKTTGGGTGPLTETLEDEKSGRGAAETLSDEAGQLMQALQLINDKKWDDAQVLDLFDKPITNRERLQQLVEQYAPFDLESAIEIDYHAGFKIYLLDRNGQYHAFSLSYDPVKITDWIAPKNEYEADEQVLSSLYE